jgi:hypothetical protein
MINYDEFKKRFPTTDDFEKAYPPGKKVVWNDRKKYTVVNYVEDWNHGKEIEKVHLVVMKRWSNHYRNWMYDITRSFVFYSVVEMMKGVLKEDKKLAKNNPK